MFCFLFKEPETLFEKYHNYISEVDGMVTALNNDFSKNHKMPLYGNDLTESNGGNLDGYDWANVDDTTKKRTGYDANSYAYKQDYSLPNGPTSQHDQPGGLISKSPIADTPTYSGKISGVNWRAFLSCVQVYNGFANDLEETNSKDRESAEKKQKEYDAYDTDNINPYGRFKDEWKSKNSNFVKPKLDVSVDCYYLESGTNNKWDNDLNKTDDEGDKKFDEYVKKLQQYYKSKEAVDKYKAEKAQYDSNMANWNNLVKVYTSMLPLVGSMITAPGFKIPLASASSIIARAIRSFTLPPGLKYSSLAIICAFASCFLLRRDSSNKGVPPMSSVNSFFILAIIFSFSGF